MIVTVLLIAVVLAIAAGAAFAIVSKRNYTKANQIVPGTDTRAPANWAGAHTPEAKLHRRLRDAMTALREHRDLGASGMLDLRVSLEQEAIAVDEQLIATAALPERVRAEPMDRVTEAVEALEDAAAGFVARSTSVATGSASLEDAVSEVNDGLRAITEARAELDRAYPDTPLASELADRIADEAEKQTAPAPAPEAENSPGDEGEQRPLPG